MKFSIICFVEWPKQKLFFVCVPDRRFSIKITGRPHLYKLKASHRFSK